MKTKWLYFIFLIATIIACKKTEQKAEQASRLPPDVLTAWQQTLKQNSIPAYQKFIQQYPDFDSLVQLAKDKIDSLEEELAWQRVKNTTSIDSLRKFCLKYPYSIHHTEAKQLANKILHRQLDIKYKVVIDFLQDMATTDNPAKTFQKYINPDFCLIKIRKYEEYSERSDTFAIHSQSDFNKYLNQKLFQVCYNTFQTGKLLENYELQCDSLRFMLIFHLSCGDVNFKWVKQDGELKLRCLEVCQDMAM